MKATISQTRIDEMTSQGYRLVGRTSGLLSFRRGTNLARKLESLGMTEADVTVVTGARAGQRRNDGHELLIFSK